MHAHRRPESRPVSILKSSDRVPVVCNVIPGRAAGESGGRGGWPQDWPHAVMHLAPIMCICRGRRLRTIATTFSVINLEPKGHREFEPGLTYYMIRREITRRWDVLHGL